MTIVAEESLAPAGRTSQVLRVRRPRAHENAERSAFVADLMGGRLGVAAYARLVGQPCTCTALEDTGARLTGDPVADAPRRPVDRAVVGIRIRGAGRRSGGELMLLVTIDYVAAIGSLRRRCTCATSPTTTPISRRPRRADHRQPYALALRGARRGAGVYRFTASTSSSATDGYRERLDALDLDRDVLARLTTEAIEPSSFNQGCSPSWRELTIRRRRSGRWRRSAGRRSTGRLLGSRRRPVRPSGRVPSAGVIATATEAPGFCPTIAFLKPLTTCVNGNDAGVPRS